jgi:hypothetical protein
MAKDTILLRNPPSLLRGIFYLLFLVPVFADAQTVVKVKDSKHHFGMVKKGVVVQYVYVLTNTSTEPLLVTAVDVSCSCTTVEYPPAPVLPGQTIPIKITFNTATLYGRQDREVEVHFNKGDSVWLRYKCIVTNAKDDRYKEPSSG